MPSQLCLLSLALFVLFVIGLKIFRPIKNKTKSANQEMAPQLLNTAQTATKVVVMFNGHNFLARAHPGIDVSGTGGRGHCQLKMFRARALTIGQRALNGHVKM